MDGILWTIPLISVSDLVFVTLITTLPKEVLLIANRAVFCFSSMGRTKRSPREARLVDLTLPTDCSNSLMKDVKSEKESFLKLRLESEIEMMMGKRVGLSLITEFLKDEEEESESSKRKRLGPLGTWSTVLSSISQLLLGIFSGAENLRRIEKRSGRFCSTGVRIERILLDIVLAFRP